MLVIRLRRVGKKKIPFYRLVVTQKTAPPQGKFIEILGFYNPKSKDKKIEIKEKRVKFWIEKGAQLSDTVNNLLCKIGFLPKSAIIKKTITKKKKKEKEEKPEKPEHIPTPKKAEAGAGSLLEEAEKEISKEEAKEKEKAKEVAEEKPAPEKEKPVSKESEKPAEETEKKEEGQASNKEKEQESKK